MLSTEYLLLVPIPAVDIADVMVLVVVLAHGSSTCAKY